MDEKKSFGDYIRRKRQQAEMTQRELAERLYVGGFWVLGGLAITAVCLLLPWSAWALWRFSGRHLPVSVLGLLTVWTFLLLAVIRALVGGRWLLPLAFPIAAYCWAAVWIYFAVIRWLPANRWIKGGLCAALTALLLPASTALADRLSGGRADPKPEIFFLWGRLFHPQGYEWINILVFLCLLALAVILLAVGAVIALRRRRP